MKPVTLIYFILLGIISNACSTQPLPPAEFTRWVEDPQNELTEEKAISDYNFVLQYRPASYLALRDAIKEDGALNIQSHTEKMNQYAGIHYFVFKIGGKDKQDALHASAASPQDYQQRLLYFTSAIQHDFWLVEGEDTLPCIFFSYEPTYKLEPYSTFTVTFDKVTGENTGDLTFIYDDKLLGCGPVHIKLEKDNLENIPPIKVD